MEHLFVIGFAVLVVIAAAGGFAFGFTRKRSPALLRRSGDEERRIETRKRELMAMRRQPWVRQDDELSPADIARERREVTLRVARRPFVDERGMPVGPTRFSANFRTPPRSAPATEPYPTVFVADSFSRDNQPPAQARDSSPSFEGGGGGFGGGGASGDWGGGSDSGSSSGSDSGSSSSGND